LHPVSLSELMNGFGVTRQHVFIIFEHTIN